MKRAALGARVSTAEQTPENHRKVAGRTERGM